MSKWTQITYLIVEMPSSRGGLLYAILAEIDLAAGTSYAKTVGQRLTVDKLWVEVAAIMALHYVGVLVIENLQLRNFSESPFLDDMMLFFLRLLSYGIPIVLVGNPMAFMALDDVSQNIRRLTKSEPIELLPALGVDDEDWDKGIACAQWRYGWRKGDASYRQVRKLIWRNSGGVPDLSAGICAGTLRLAQEGGRRTLKEVKAYCDESPRLARMRDLIDGFADKDPFKLSRYVDIPWEDYALRLWGYKLKDIIEVPADDEPAATADLDPDEAKALARAHDRLRRRYAFLVRKERASKGKTRAGARAPAAGTPASRHLAAGLAGLRPGHGRDH